MPPVNRTVPDDGYVLCTDCDGSGLCMVCGGKGNVGGKQCNLCFGGKKCRLCGGSGQLRREDDGDRAKAGGAHYVRGTQLAKDLLEGMDAPDDPARIAQNEEHERRNAELLEVYYVRSGQQPPTARTTAEMELAMRLVPCERCASREVAKPAVRGSGTAWTLDAVCAKCGDERTMAFTTKGDPRSVAHAADELGPGPSLWSRKETFDAELTRLLPQVDRDPSAAHQALLCVNELIKLVRPGKELDKLLVHRAALLAKKS